MSDTTNSTVEAEPAGPVNPPRAITLAIAAACTQVFFSVLYAVLTWPLSDQLRRTVINTNARTKKTPLCDITPGKGCLDVAKSVHAYQIDTSIGTLLVSIGILLLVRRIRRTNRSARPMYAAISLIGAVVGFAGSPLSILAVVSAGPVLPRVISTLGAAAGLAAIVLLFLPTSASYFAPPVQRRSGSSRGFGGLFSPRPRKPMPPTGLRRKAAAPTAAAPTAAGNPAKGGGRGVRAKERANDAAVARGAALARSRAKASKSRRTEL